MTEEKKRVLDKFKVKDILHPNKEVGRMVVEEVEKTDKTLREDEVAELFTNSEWEGIQEERARKMRYMWFAFHNFQRLMN